jgi:integrase
VPGARVDRTASAAVERGDATAPGRHPMVHNAPGAVVSMWAARANLQPGEPVFRPIDKGQRIGAERLTDRSVSRIIKARVRAYAIANGMSKADAEALVARFSGHSLRAGYATAAAAQDVPSYRIQQHTRHKSAEMVARYIREADKWTKNGLEGVGF